MSTNLVRMLNIHKWFGEVHALKGIDFMADKSEVVALVGDNGAGKSTLIKILSGVIHPDKGDIIFNGDKVTFRSARDALDLGIATVHQDQTVVGQRSVAQNVFLGREYTKSFGPLKILDNKRMRSEALQRTQELGLDIDSADQLVRFCSGGERQGVALARAMHFNSDLVILDEPTTALSAKGRKQVLRYVDQLVQSEEVGIIFITHNISHVYPIADKFVVLKHGEKVAELKREETSRNEIEDILS